MLPERFILNLVCRSGNRIFEFKICLVKSMKAANTSSNQYDFICLSKPHDSNVAKSIAILMKPGTGFLTFYGGNVH